MKNLAAFFACLILLTAGCGSSLSFQSDLEIEMGDASVTLVDAVSHEQTVHITAKSPGAPIHVHVYLSEHDEAVERKITLGKPPENLLAQQADAEEISLEAVVPANKEVFVRIQPAGPHSAKVHLEITN